MTPSATDLSACIRKKRKSVAKTLGKITGVAIAVLAVCYALWLGLPTIMGGAEAVASLIEAVSSIVAAALASVPWWCWVILGIVAVLALVLVVYPWAWCVSREFNHSDEMQVSAYGCGLGRLIGGVILLGFGLFGGFYGICTGVVIYFIIAGTGGLFVDPYLHYRRRIAQEEKEGEEKVV